MLADLTSAEWLTIGFGLGQLSAWVIVLGILVFRKPRSGPP